MQNESQHLFEKFFAIFSQGPVLSSTSAVISQTAPLLTYMRNKILTIWVVGRTARQYILTFHDLSWFVVLKWLFINIYTHLYSFFRLNYLPHSSLSPSCYLHWIIQPYLPIPSRRLPFRWAHQIRSAYVFGFREGCRSAYRRRVGDQKDVFMAYLRRICPVLLDLRDRCTLVEITQNEQRCTQIERPQDDQDRSSEQTESRDNT